MDRDQASDMEAERLQGISDRQAPSPLTPSSSPNSTSSSPMGSAGTGTSAARPSIWAQLPLMIVTIVLSTGVAFALFSVLSRPLKTDVAEQKNSFRDEKREVHQRLVDAETMTNKLLSESKAVRGEVEKLKVEKKELRKALAQTVEALGQAQEGLAGITGQLSRVADDQGKRDAGQNEEITKVSNRVTYIERRMKSLVSLEADVMGLKNDTGNLKGQYTNLKKDLKIVQDKGDVTQKELVDLGERSRMFQLRVLAARAREAAEAARQGDLKKLLARLSEEE